MDSRVVNATLDTVPSTVVEPGRTRPRVNRIVLGIVPALGVLAVIFFTPIGVLLWRSFSEPEIGIANYTAIIHDPTAMTILIRTFVVAFVITAATLMIGYPYAYMITRASDAVRKLLLAVVLVAFWSSLLAKSFAWIVILQDSGPLNTIMDFFGLPKTHLLGTQAGVTIGMIQVLLPFAILPLYATMTTIDSRLMVAAQGLGARRSVAFLKVYLPLSAPGVLAAGLLVFVLSLGFYITPDLLGSPKSTLLSQLIAIRVQTLLDFPGAGALGATLLVITLLVIGVAARLTRGLVSNESRRT